MRQTGQWWENRIDDQTLMENHLNRPEIQQALADGVGMSTRFSTTLSVRLLYVAVPVTVNGNPAGFVRVALPLSDVEQTIRQLQQRIWMVLLVATLLGMALAFTIAHLIARPVVAITRLADRIAAGGAALPAERYPYLNTRDEMGRLAQALERMARQLQDRIGDLQNEQMKLSALLSQMTDGVIIVDPAGLVSLMNPAAEQIFAVTEQKAIRLSLVRALGYHQLHDLWQQSHKESQEKIISLELTHQRRFIQVVATPLDGALQDFTLLLCQDMTHQRRLETVRRDFISNISHELRTPLASLKALAESLQISSVDDPETTRHFLERMDTEIDALIQMVNELLELARIESERVPLQLEPVEPCELLVKAANRLKMQAERGGIQLEMDCPTGLPLIQADSPRLEQVLVNLIHNAIKFTPPGGSITVFVVPPGQPDGGKVCFGVRDTGIGIPPDMLGRVFERFYKTDPSRSGGGTGLGLSISRHLVETHSGQIWAESEPGKGSTFYFTIPTVKI